jgi:hypothetical protein
MARRKVIEWLIHRLEKEVDDAHFVMELWLMKRSDGQGIVYHNERDIPYCKTAGCLAGTLFLGLPAKIRKAYVKIGYTDSRDRMSANIEGAAQEQLGLTDQETRCLFIPDIHNLKLVKRMHAIAVLKRMLTHSEINWQEANPDIPFSVYLHPVSITLTDD